MKKLFRLHRGGFAESLATTTEVTGLSDMKAKLRSMLLCPVFYNNIRIDKMPLADPRLPKEWEGVSYYILADFDGYRGQCIGMCNFYEE